MTAPEPGVGHGKSCPGDAGWRAVGLLSFFVGLFHEKNLHTRRHPEMARLSLHSRLIRSGADAMWRANDVTGASP
jgi:hypothetical protein